MGIEPMRTDPPAPKAGALTTRPSQRKHRKEGNGTIYGLKMPDLEILPTSGQSTNQHLTLRAAIKPENMPSVILATGFPPPQLHNNSMLTFSPHQVAMTTRFGFGRHPLEFVIVQFNIQTRYASLQSIIFSSSNQCCLNF